jgi:hypothetical protein
VTYGGVHGSSSSGPQDEPLGTHPPSQRSYPRLQDEGELAGAFGVVGGVFGVLG